ncbi:hypothetical protein FHG87_002261 [Trinorchestia longiramus]|nr:hypothetical protein FHG87_002261 [Trinorchestia longiramus]
MDGIKLSVHHATHYEMESSEDDYSDLSSEDLAEVEDVMEDATIEYPELANASVRRHFIHQLSSTELHGSHSNHYEASGSDYFAQEIGFNFDNSEQAFFLNPVSGDDIFAHNSVSVSALLDKDVSVETASNNLTSSAVTASAPKHILQADSSNLLEIRNADFDEARQCSEQLLGQNTPSKLPSNKNAERTPEFKVVRREPSVTCSVGGAPVIEKNAPLLATSNTTTLNIERRDVTLLDAKRPLNASPSLALSSNILPNNASHPVVTLDAHHVSESTNVPNSPLPSGSCTTNSSIPHESLVGALQHNLVKKTPADDSYNETTTTDLSRESSLSSACRLSLSDRRGTNECDASGCNNNAMEANSGKSKGKKKKAAQTRRAHNSRAFKNTTEQQSSGRDSSSDELNRQKWISNRPITRHFFNNIDEFCNRASRPRKPKPKSKPRKNANSTKPALLNPIPAAAFDSPTALQNNDLTPAVSAAWKEEKHVESVALVAQEDTFILPDSNITTESYIDDLFEEEDLIGMFPSHLSQVIEEAGLNISDLNFSSSVVFDDLRCDESVIDDVDENGSLMPLSDSVTTAALPLPSITASVHVESNPPTNLCKNTIEVVNFTDNTSTLATELVDPLTITDDNRPLSAQSDELDSVDSNSDSVVGSIITNSDVISSSAKPHISLMPESSSGRDDATAASSPELPHIRPGSVVLAIMDSSGNLVPVSNTCITMEDVQSAVAGELGSSFRDEINLSTDGSSEAVCKTQDVKPDVSSLDVQSSLKIPACNRFDAYETKPNKDKVFVASACALIDDQANENETNVNWINVKREVVDEPVLYECKIETSSLSLPSSSPTKKSDSVNDSARSSSINQGQNNSNHPTQNGTDGLTDLPATTLPVNDKDRLSLLTSSTQGVICKIPDYLQTIFREQECESKALEHGNSCDANSATGENSEAEVSEAGATDAEDKRCLINTGSDSSDPSNSQAARKKINVSEYFKRRHCSGDGAERNLRSVSVIQVKQEKETACSKPKSPSQTLKVRPEINIKSMLSDNVPEYSNAVVSPGSCENKDVEFGVTKLAQTGKTSGKVKLSKGPTAKLTSQPKPDTATEVSDCLLLRDEAQNVQMQSKEILKTAAKVNQSKTNVSEAFKIKDSSTASEDTRKLLVTKKLNSIPSEAKREVVTRVVKKVLSACESLRTQKRDCEVELKEHQSPDSRSSSSCSGQVQKNGKVEREVCQSPRSRGSSHCSGRGRKRDRSSSLISTCYSSDSNDGRRSRRRHRRRSTSPSLSPIPLFRKKRNKKSHKRRVIFSYEKIIVLVCIVIHLSLHWGTGSKVSGNSSNIYYFKVILLKPHHIKWVVVSVYATAKALPGLSIIIPFGSEI